MFERLRLRRIARSYDRIKRLEPKAGKEAYLMRVAFARETHKVMDDQFKANQIPRTQRRQMRREVVRG
jgi:hypothetical protein